MERLAQIKAHFEFIATPSNKTNTGGVKEVAAITLLFLLETLNL